MSTAIGTKLNNEGLIFGIDSGYPQVNSNFKSSRFFKGMPVTNYISNIPIADYNKPQSAYRCNLLQDSIEDNQLFSKKYSTYTGVDLDSNNQLFSKISDALDVRNSTVTYSVSLKGEGTCHLTVYSDADGYGTSSTITLTDSWVRYSYTRSVSNYTSNCWGAVRGVLSTTTVSIGDQQITNLDRGTPFSLTSRNSSESILDITGNHIINSSLVSWDSNAKFNFNTTGDHITFDLVKTPNMTFESVIKTDHVQSSFMLFNAGDTSKGPDLYLTGGNLCWNIWDGGSNPFCPLPSNWSNNNYHHIVVVNDNDNSLASLYFDGELLGTATFRLCQDLKMSIGGDEASYNYNGYIDVFRVYNIALDSTSIKSNFETFINKRFK